MSQEDKQGVTAHVEDIKGHKVVFTGNTSKGRQVSLRRTDEHIVMGSKGAGDFGLCPRQSRYRRGEDRIRRLARMC